MNDSLKTDPLKTDAPKTDLLKIDALTLLTAERAVGDRASRLIETKPHVTTLDVVESYVGMKLRQFRASVGDKMNSAAALELLDIAAACTCCYARILEDAVEKNENQETGEYHGD